MGNQQAMLDIALSVQETCKVASAMHRYCGAVSKFSHQTAQNREYYNGMLCFALEQNGKYEEALAAGRRVRQLLCQTTSISSFKVDVSNALIACLREWRSLRTIPGHTTRWHMHCSRSVERMKASNGTAESSVKMYSQQLTRSQDDKVLAILERLHELHAYTQLVPSCIVPP